MGSLTARLVTQGRSSTHCLLFAGLLFGQDWHFKNRANRLGQSVNRSTLTIGTATLVPTESSCQPKSTAVMQTDTATAMPSLSA